MERSYHSASVIHISLLSLLFFYWAPATAIERIETSDVEGELRIVGGTEITNSSSYPYIAFSSGYLLCGSTLIWSDILLSAGHCSEAFQNGGVWLGGIQLSGGDGEFHYVDQVSVHPDYPSASTQPNDIMLVKLSTSSALQTVSLAANSAQPGEGFTVKVVGFGRTTEGGLVSQTAKEVEVNVVNFAACDDLYGGKLLEDKQFCTDGNGDSCQGDSGGPLLNQYGEQVGVVSFGEGCDRYQSVNTRVSHYADWIQLGICSLSSNPPTNCPGVAPTTIAQTSSPIPPPSIPLTPAPTFAPVEPYTIAPMNLPSSLPSKVMTNHPTLGPSESFSAAPTLPSTTFIPSYVLVTSSPTRNQTTSIENRTVEDDFADNVENTTITVPVQSFETNTATGATTTTGTTPTAMPSSSTSSKTKSLNCLYHIILLLLYLMYIL
jgi:V8-like Glu-specific endopeptidase